MRRASSSRFCILLAMLALLLVTAGLYAPALKFGFMWDDPVWLGRVVEKSWVELLKPMPTYQFYRPIILLYHRLFLGPDNTFNAPLLHAAQLGWHLLNVVLVYALSRRLALNRWASLAAAGLVAWYPFSHQAVAWAAAHQPLATTLQNGAWLAYIEARPREKARSACLPPRPKPALRSSETNRRLMAALSLLLFLAALASQESTVFLAIVPLLLDWVQRRRVGWLALIYPLLAAAFGLFWLTLPREPGHVGLTFQGPTLLYFLQGFLFPLLGRPAGYNPGQAVAPALPLALGGFALTVLLTAAWRNGRGRQALFGLAFAMLGIAPSAFGLSYTYVDVSSRLVYYARGGIALLWVCALYPPSPYEGKGRGEGLAHRLRRALGAAALALIAVQSSLLLVGFQHMYAVGAAHIAELTQVAQSGERRLLFINFPDQYFLKRPPYPLGRWGVFLAPGSIDLGAFPASVTGQRPETISRRMPWIDAETRDAGPYQIDMRGELAAPDQLYQLAQQVDAIYLSRYSADGTFALQWTGALTSTTLPAGPVAACRLAVFGETLCLQAAQVEQQPGRLSLTLTWLSLSKAKPNDTLFAHLGHVGQPPVAQGDGDAWLGLLPLSALRPGDVIREQRIILLPEGLPLEQYEVRVGVYNRVSGQRLPATTPQGDPLPDNAITIRHYP